jgi:gamma-glutamyltranspeptidase/glutathione hydrolase
LTADDMAGWRATWEESASYDYGRYRVHKTGPWGQGPVLLQQLALLKGFDLAAMDLERRRVRPCGHRMLETRVRRS